VVVDVLFVDVDLPGLDVLVGTTDGCDLEDDPAGPCWPR
jgi:hypothetical protein